MRKHARIAWCLLPLGVILFHFTAGQRLLFAEKSIQLRLLGKTSELAGNHKKAVRFYLSAENAAHPKDVVLRTRLRTHTLTFEDEVRRRIARLEVGGERRNLERHFFGFERKRGGGREKKKKKSD